MAKSRTRSPSSSDPSDVGFCTGFMQWLRGPSRRAHYTRVALCVALRVVLPVLVVVLLGMAIGWVFRTRKLAPPPPSPFVGRTITFDLTITNIDPLAAGGTMALGWNLIHDSCYGEVIDGDDDNGISGSANVQGNTSCSTVNIYMDTNLFASSTATPNVIANNSLPDTPIFQFIPREDQDWRGNSPRFETNLAMWVRGHQLYSTLLNYPFDQYWGNIVIFAKDNVTEEPVGISIGHTDGVAVGYDAMFYFDRDDSGFSLHDFDEHNKKDGSLYLILYARRTVLVRAYVVTLVIAMWLITLLLLAITIQATFYGYDVDMTILAAPVATLFAFTTLRTALPGAPGTFGAVIDFVGTLPSLAVLIAIAVLSLIHILVRSKRKYESRNASDA